MPGPASYFIAGGEIIGVNLLIWAGNRFLLNSPYSLISGETMLRNLSGPWVWDQDEFPVNQIMHPYQGMLHFTAARGNGINFYASGLFAAGGSLMWEYLLENEPPSLNDIITNTTVGMIWGEMFHRLYIEAAGRKKWYAFIASPMDGLNSLIYKPSYSRYAGRIEELSFRITLNSGMDSRSFSADIAPVRQWHFVNFGGDFRVIYRDAYGLDTRIPFEHFVMRFSAEMSPLYYSMYEKLPLPALSFFTHGFLFSFDMNRGSLGMGAHFDGIWHPSVEWTAQSVGLTYKEENVFGRDWRLRWETHVHWVFLNAVDYYYYAQHIIPNETGLERRWYNLGTGIGFKAGAEWIQEVFGRLHVEYSFYAAYTPQALTALEASGGWSILGLVRGEYRHKAGRYHSLGIEAELLHRLDLYEAAPSIFLLQTKVNLFISFDLI